MKWAEKRIEEYKKGEKATCLEKMALEHGHPVNCIASIIAFAFLAYGLWTHEIIWIIIGVVIGVLAHLYLFLKE